MCHLKHNLGSLGNKSVPRRFRVDHKEEPQGAGVVSESATIHELKDFGLHNGVTGDRSGISGDRRYSPPPNAAIPASPTTGGPLYKVYKRITINLTVTLALYQDRKTGMA